MGQGSSDQEDKAAWPSLTCMESLGTAHRGQCPRHPARASPPPRSPTTARKRCQAPAQSDQTAQGLRHKRGGHGSVAAHPAQWGRRALTSPPPHVPTPALGAQAEPGTR